MSSIRIHTEGGIPWFILIKSFMKFLKKKRLHLLWICILKQDAAAKQIKQRGQKGLNLACFPLCCCFNWITTIPTDQSSLAACSPTSCWKFGKERAKISGSLQQRLSVFWNEYMNKQPCSVALWIAANMESRYRLLTVFFHFSALTRVTLLI